ncbi:TerB N-terminal domain-containing protein [Anaerocolumna jejuensis DSM 15929]|uniref:TerB N-terminal domain-containing protein n=1 Tax=Anaerocolumna jejuensis DSM 15929 TaxID=1121322 RepID=A0A1M6KP41_9FIRM|nr:TerB N-terminal domain-containing protein [Anaerocolumna jejuensis]SHJ60699.1 TerB N-terminal domain-containing protein [Anaerocolumna jejuensis DSM 15929]
MELSEVYSKLIDVSPFTLNFNMGGMVSECMLSVYDGLLEQDFDDEIPENGIKLGETREQAELLKSELRVMRSNLEKQIEVSNEEYKNSIKTREEAFLYNAELLRNIDAYSGSVDEAYQKYAKNYPDFDIETFTSYIYWRTQVRNKRYIKAAPCFIYMYLRELCNFTEKETPEEVWGILNEMLSAYSIMEGCSSITRYINNSMLDFSLLYGVHIENSELYVRDALLRKYEDTLIKYKISIGNFSNTFDYFNKHSSYKITKSRFYSDRYIDVIKKCFPIVMEDLYKFFQDSNLPVFNLWVGELVDCPYRLEETIYTINRQYYSDRYIQIDDIFHLNIENEKIMTKQLHAYKNDKGMCVCGRSYTMIYVLQCFENELRKIVGFKYKLHPSNNEIEKMLSRYDAPLLKEIINIYTSEEFLSTVRNAIEKAIK